MQLQGANSNTHPSSSTICGHVSLPTNGVINDRQELNKLQESRLCIQEDCDQLLLKKERLKTDIASSPFFMNCNFSAILCCDGNVKQCDYDGPENAPIQAPIAVDVGCGSVSFLHTGFKVMAIILS